MILFAFQLYLFLSSVESITISGLGFWRKPKENRCSWYAKSQVPCCLCSTSGVHSSLVSYFFHHSSFSCETHSNAFKTLKKNSIWCVIICSSLCNAHVKDSILPGWSVDGKFIAKKKIKRKREWNKTTVVPVSPSMKSDEKKTNEIDPFPSFLSHSSLLSFLHLICVRWFPSFGQIFLIPSCFNHPLNNLSVCAESPGVFICFMIDLKDCYLSNSPLYLWLHFFF